MRDAGTWATIVMLVAVTLVGMVVAAAAVGGFIHGPTVGDLVEKEMREGTWERENGGHGQE